MHEHLQAMADELKFCLEMHEFDLIRDSSQDVLVESFWLELIGLIQKCKPFCVIATPPCSTYSRARHFYKQSPGPRPIRSRQHPRGFPWLRDRDRQKAEQGTLLAERTWELFDLANDLGAFFLGEFPEDLGATSTGVPASFWQMPQFQDTLLFPGCHSFAIFQCQFGALSPKPTRFISNLQHFEGPTFDGVPHFDSAWKYLGPLPKSCPHPGEHRKLIGADKTGGWLTAPAAHYPGDLCKFLAVAIAKTWQTLTSAPTGKISSAKGVSPATLHPEPLMRRENDCEEKIDDDTLILLEDEVENDEKEVENDEKEANPLTIQSGCEGPPIKARYAGRCEEFCDGFGLCSPGRWHPSSRQRSRTEDQRLFCNSVRALIQKFCIENIPHLARATFELALGRMKESIFESHKLERLRDEWYDLLPDKHLARSQVANQPFKLHALAQSLRQMGDPDVDIIDNVPGSNFSDGVHIGHLWRLGPTPQVYREREKWPKYDESDLDFEMLNYFKGKEEDAARILEEQFKEEESEGRMTPLSAKEAIRRYPGDALRIAAQGILEKPDGGGYRIIHDGTHGVQLNNEICIEDRLENPGPRELATIMEVSKSQGENVIFGVNADISKAHRRVLVREEDWGVQACRTSSTSTTIWLNRTGTFGVASAAYWWSRLMGLIGRFGLNILGNDWVFVLIFVDDLHLAAGGSNRWLSIWTFLVAMEMVGVPFSFHKFRGGFQLDYVGFWLDYGRFEIGLSEKRSRWLIAFVDSLGEDAWLVNVKRFQEFHGRLGFASQVLPWIRPLLGPGYAWLAAVGRASTLKVPELLSMVCMCIRDRFKSGMRKIPCGVREKFLGELYRTDAKCEPGRVVLGGWKIYGGVSAQQAQWFSLEIFPGQAPWLFRGSGNESSWASTSAELLASAVALQIFDFGKEFDNLAKSHILHCGAGTDNRATESISGRRITTKLPLMIVLMDYLAICESRRLRCNLCWRPRDANVEADDLTNGVFDKFDSCNRIDISWKDLRFPFITSFMPSAGSLSKKRILEDLKVDSGKSEKFQKSSWG